MLQPVKKYYPIIKNKKDNSLIISKKSPIELNKDLIKKKICKKNASSSLSSVKKHHIKSSSFDQKKMNMTNSNSILCIDKKELFDKLFSNSREYEFISKYNQARLEQSELMQERQKVLKSIHLKEDNNGENAKDSNELFNFDNLLYKNKPKINLINASNISNSSFAPGTALIDAHANDFLQYFYHDSKAPNIIQKVIRTKSLYSQREPGETFYFSNNFNEYFTINRNDLKKKHILYQAKKKINKKFYNKIKNYSMHKENYFGKLFYNENSKFNKIKNETTPFSQKDILLAISKNDPQALVNSLYNKERKSSIETEKETNNLELNREKIISKVQNNNSSNSNINVNINNNTLKYENENCYFNSEIKDSEDTLDFYSKNEQAETIKNDNSYMKIFEEAEERLKNSDNKYYVHNLEKLNNFLREKDDNYNNKFKRPLSHNNPSSNKTKLNREKYKNKMIINELDEKNEESSNEEEEEENDDTSFIKSKRRKNRQKNKKNKFKNRKSSMSSSLLSSEKYKLNKKYKTINIAKLNGGNEILKSESNITTNSYVKKVRFCSEENTSQRMSEKIRNKLLPERYSTDLRKRQLIDSSSNTNNNINNLEPSKQSKQYSIQREVSCKSPDIFNKKLLINQNHQFNVKGMYLSLVNNRRKNGNLSCNINSNSSINDNLNPTNENTISYLNNDYLHCNCFPYKTSTKIQNIAYSKIDRFLKEKKKYSLTKQDNNNCSSSNNNFFNTNQNTSNNKGLIRPMSCDNFYKRKSFMEYLGNSGNNNWIKDEGHHSRSNSNIEELNNKIKKEKENYFKDSFNNNNSNIGSNNDKLNNVNNKINYIYMNQYIDSSKFNEPVKCKKDLNDTLVNNYINRVNRKIYFASAKLNQNKRKSNFRNSNKKKLDGLKHISRTKDGETENKRVMSSFDRQKIFNGV